MIVVGGSGGSTLRQVVGREMGQLYTFGYLRDAEGRQVFDKASGRPMRGGLINVGNALPRYFGGITNTFTFKGISLSTLIDFKLGHKMIVRRGLLFAVQWGKYKKDEPGCQTHR